MIEALGGATQLDGDRFRVAQDPTHRRAQVNALAERRDEPST